MEPAEGRRRWTRLSYIHGRTVQALLGDAAIRPGVKVPSIAQAANLLHNVACMGRTSGTMVAEWAFFSSHVISMGPL